MTKDETEMISKRSNDFITNTLQSNARQVALYFLTTDSFPHFAHSRLVYLDQLYSPILCAAVLGRV
jgi:hypothetical protein